MMNRVIVWGILCVMFYGHANGQDVWNDQVMDTNQQDYSLFQSLIDSSFQVKDNTVKKQLLLHALEIAQNEKDSRREAKASYYLGKLYFQTGNTTEANVFFEKVNGFVEEYPEDFSPHQKAMSYFLTAKNYSYLNQYQKSLEYFKKSQIICEQNSISGIQIDVLRQIGNVFFYLGDIASSTNYYYESLRLAQEHNNTPKEVDALNNIATNMIDIGKENDAKKLFQQALKLAQANNMAGRIATISNNLGVIFFNELQLEKSIDYFNLALSFAMDREDVYSKGIYYNNLAKVYIELGNFQKARSLMENCFANISIVNDKEAFGSYYATKSKYYIATKHFDSASIYINKVLAVSEELSSINYRKNYYFLKYEYYKAQDDYQRALENYIRNQQIADSITSQESNHKIAQLQAYYKQQKENERYTQLLEQKSNLRQYLLLATMLSFLVIAELSSGRGEPFDGSRALKLFIDRQDEIREMTGDPEWASRFFAINILLHDEDERSARAVWESFEDPHALIRSTVIREIPADARPFGDDAATESSESVNTSLYEVLFNLLLNDPVFEVRQVAKNRIMEDFATAYSLDIASMNNEQILHVIQLLSPESPEDQDLALRILSEDDLELRQSSAGYLQECAVLPKVPGRTFPAVNKFRAGYCRSGLGTRLPFRMFFKKCRSGRYFEMPFPTNPALFEKYPERHLAPVCTGT